MDYGNLKVPENVTPEVQAILDSYEARNKEIENNHRKNMAKLYGGAALQLGSAFIPGTLGLKAAGGAIKALTPYVGKKIAENVATGTISGLASGAVEGLGRGLMEGENPLKTMVSDATLGTLFGGAFGLAGGKIGKKLAEKNLQNNNIAPQKYFDDYVAGLKGDPNTIVPGKVPIQNLYKPEEIKVIRAQRQFGNDFGGSETLPDIIADENGNPIPFYHATPNAGFEEFNPLSFFTKDKEYAKGYMDKNASALGFKKTADNPGVYEVNLDFNKPFDTRNPVDRNIFLNEYQAYYSPELTDRGMVDWMEVEDLAEWLQDKYPQYDGIIADEGGYGGPHNFGVWKGESYIPFSGKQVKINKLTTDQGETIFNNPRQ